MFGPRATQRLNRSLGIRADEGPTVRLFFLHNFLLGVGTMLVYVAANVILLENNPETSLPVAYVLSALGMIAVGRVYAHFEHHLRLSQLVVRVLWAVVALVVVVTLLVALGHSVWAAVGIMVGFRAIYLLTNLEFWAVSALVFDVRQGKRLFSIISAGDLPAKALGAMLVVLIHNHGDLLILLFIAAGFYGAALWTTTVTVRRHGVHTPHKAAPAPRRPVNKLNQRLFGGSPLISAVCLTLLPVAVVAAGIEYEFFTNVKHRYHDQSEVMQTLGYVLALTYLVALAVKLLISRRTVEQMGLRATLQLLPGVALTGLLAYAVVALRPADETTRILYFCGLYLAFEVVRRSLFDAVLLVLFQPLPAQQRLQGHTLAKGLFEPLGMAIAGVLLFAIRHLPIHADGLWLLATAVFGGIMVWAVNRTYRQYVATLQDALGKRFVAVDELALPAEVLPMIDRTLAHGSPDETLIALDYLNRPDWLAARAPALLTHPDAGVRAQTLAKASALNVAGPPVRLPPDLLDRLARRDADDTVRQQAAQLLARLPEHPTARALLASADLPARHGAIVGFLKEKPSDAPARSSLADLARSPVAERQLTALRCLADVVVPGQEAFVEENLRSNQPDRISAALNVVPNLPAPNVLAAALPYLTDRQHWRAAVRNMAAVGDALLPALPAVPPTPDNARLLRRMATVAGRLRSDAGRQWLLTQLAHAAPILRLPLLVALKDFPPTTQDDTLFHRLLNDEVALAQRLLAGMTSGTDATLDASLTYEGDVVVDRILLLLMGLYDHETVNNVRQSINHQTAERRANSLELLENLIPRTVYAALQALVEPLPLPERRQLLGLDNVTQDIRPYIRAEGRHRFTDWTVLVAQTNVVNLLSPDTAMHSADTDTQATLERVFVLRNTSLFGDTPANVLASIAPIMKEVRYADGEDIVRKDELGTCMFVIQRGEVDVHDGQTHFATLRRGDVFGELALLDAEPRSATVTATSNVALFRLDQDDFYDLMDERDEVLRNVIRMLCSRIRQQNRQRSSAA